MEFKSLTNIETSFRQIRLYAFVFAIVCVAVGGYAVYASYGFAKEQREKIYVLDQGKHERLSLVKHIDFLPLLLGEAVRGIDGIDTYSHAYDGEDKGVEPYLPE